jgi:hypothetical protein
VFQPPVAGRSPCTHIPALLSTASGYEPSRLGQAFHVRVRRPGTLSPITRPALLVFRRSRLFTVLGSSLSHGLSAWALQAAIRRGPCISASVITFVATLCQKSRQITFKPMHGFVCVSRPLPTTPYFFVGTTNLALLRRRPSSPPAQLAPVLVQLRHFGTIRSRVGPFQKVSSKGCDCFSMKKCAWQDSNQSKSPTSATPTYFGSGKLEALPGHLQIGLVKGKALLGFCSPGSLIPLCCLHL